MNMRYKFNADKMVKRREFKGIPQNKLAHLMQVSQALISSIENGHKLPGIKTLCHLAYQLEVDPGYFFTDTWFEKHE